MPLIGIAQCAHTVDYEAAIQRAGAEFRLLDPLLADAEVAVRDLDGLLLTGGGDVDPALFGESRTRRITPPSPGATSTRSRSCARRSPPIFPCWRSAAACR
jgi:putative glutamine amidotransferase